MNSAISYVRPHCSPIIKTYIIFLFRWGPFSFLLIISFSFMFLSSIILAPISLISLSPSAQRLYLPFRRNPSQSIQPSWSLSQWSLFLSFFFLFIYLSLWFDVRFGSGCVGYEFGVLGHGLMCSGDFMGLGLWICVRGSSTWPTWII